MPGRPALPFISVLMPLSLPRPSLSLLALLVLATLTGWHSAHAAGVVFRYLPGQPALSSETVVSGVETGPFLDPRELTARGPGGWGLQAPYAAEFEGGSSTLRSMETEPLSQPLGPRLTAEVWVSLTSVEGRTPLLSNLVSGEGGFELGLEGAVPYFMVTAGGRDLRVDADMPVAPGTPVWVAATSRFDAAAQVLHLTLYVDGHVAAATAVDIAIPSPYTIARPFFVGTEATGTPEAYDLEGKLSGQLLAAVVRDYVAKEAYLASPIPHDGGPYFGLPDYHDYPLTTFELPMDQRIRDNPSEIRHRFYVPYVNDEYVPQGTATHVEVTEGDTTALVYLSYYHRTRGGSTGQARSIVTEIDAATGHVRRTFRLMGVLGYSHAGGIAHVGDALYVASASKLERYPLPPYGGDDADRYIDLGADASGTISVYGRASFVSEHSDTLWVGDWRTPSHEAPYLYGYPLAEDGRPVPNADPAVYALPRSVQGVDFFEHGGETVAFMARNRSLSRGEAEILRVPRARFKRWQEPEADSVITVPYGIEDLSFFPDGTLWTNSESGADYYQKGDGSWGVFYPFVYSLPPEAVFGNGFATSSAEPPGIPSPGLRLSAAPNPSRGATTLTASLERGGPARLYVTDVLGRRVATLLDGPAPPGTLTATWNPASYAAGLYFVVLESGGGRVVRSITRVR